MGELSAARKRKSGTASVYGIFVDGTKLKNGIFNVQLEEKYIETRFNWVKQNSPISLWCCEW